MTKIRKQFFIDVELVKWLEQESKRTGLSQAEIVRKAIERKQTDKGNETN